MRSFARRILHSFACNACYAFVRMQMACECGACLRHTLSPSSSPAPNGWPPVAAVCNRHASSKRSYPSENAVWICLARYQLLIGKPHPVKVAISRNFD